MSFADLWSLKRKVALLPLFLRSYQRAKLNECSIDQWYNECRLSLRQLNDSRKECGIKNSFYLPKLS